MLLTLPTISPEVPALIEFSPAGERHLRLALNMSRLGMIDDEDIARLRKNRIGANALRQVIEAGWLNEVRDVWRFNLLSAYARLVIPTSGDEEFVGANGEALVGVVINAGTPQWVTVGKAFTEIEALRPGLGRTALGYVESVLSRFGRPHTPGGAFTMCQYLHWHGEGDESLAMEELGEDADVPRRDVMFDGVPEWAYVDYDPNLATVSREEFDVACAVAGDHPVSALLRAIKELRDLDQQPNGFLPGYDSENTDGYIPEANEPPILLAWAEEEDMLPIYDDNYQYFAQGGDDMAPWVGALLFEPTTEGISNALTRVLHTGNVLGALDRVLAIAKELSEKSITHHLS